MADKTVVVTGGGAMSVFWGLFLFFIVLPVVAGIGCLACTGSLFWGAANSVNHAVDRERQKQQAEPPQQPVLVSNETSTPEPTPAVSPSSTPDPRIPFGTSGGFGDVEVTVLEATVGKVPLKGIGDSSGMSSDDALMVKLSIANNSSKRKIDYAGLNPEIAFTAEKIALLEDSDGNHYKRISFSGFNKPVGSSGRTSVYPGKSITDVLVFETPIESFTDLNLTIPGAAFGADGELVFRIPHARVSLPGRPAEAIEAAPTDRPDPNAPVVKASPTAPEPINEPDSPLAKEPDKRPRWAVGGSEPPPGSYPVRLPEEFREWTGANGKKIEAKFKSFGAGKVKLEKRDGKVITTPIEKLSDDDQALVRKKLKN